MDVPALTANIFPVANNKTNRLGEAGLLNKSSCLAPTLGVTKFTNVRDMNLVTLCCAT
jgi:hypothetical protein